MATRRLFLYIRDTTQGNCPAAAVSPKVILKLRLVLIPHFGELIFEKSFFGFDIVLELKNVAEVVEVVRISVVKGVVSCVLLVVGDCLTVCLLLVVFGTDIATVAGGLTV